MRVSRSGLLGAGVLRGRSPGGRAQTDQEGRPSPAEIRLPLLWIALLYGRVKASLAATTGVHSHVEAIKYLMAGADVVMSTSALLQQGPAFLSRLISDVSGWMYRKGYTSVSQLRGSMSQQSIPDSGAFVRGNYIRVLESYSGPRAKGQGLRAKG